MGRVVATKSDKRIRIAILLGAPFSEQNYERIGIPYLSANFELTVYDCTKWLGVNTNKIQFKKAFWPHICLIESAIELDSQIKSHRPNYAIDFIGSAQLLPDICEILAKHNVRLVLQKTGNLPVEPFPSRVSRFFRHLINRNLNRINVINTKSISKNNKNIEINLISKITQLLHSKIKSNLLAIKLRRYPNYIGLLAGAKSLNLFTRRCNPIIWIASNDFHTYNRVFTSTKNNNGVWTKGNYILFIDDNLPNASDWLILGVKPPVTEDIYYDALISFFQKLESTYGLPIVIAGHPSSSTDQSYKMKMGGRLVEFGKTAELVLRSDLVLLHGSTAVSFAVLARKPTIFLTTRELENSFYGMHIKIMANTLGSQIILIDDPMSYLTDANLNSYSEKKYARYQENYLKSEASYENEPWSAFTSFVLEEQKINI